MRHAYDLNSRFSYSREKPEGYQEESLADIGNGGHTGFRPFSNDDWKSFTLATPISIL